MSPYHAINLIALNPQPLPPRYSWQLLNPQPLPPRYAVPRVSPVYYRF